MRRPLYRKPSELTRTRRSSSSHASASRPLVAAIQKLDLSGSPDEQAAQVRDAIRLLFPEAVTLVREAREGLS